MGERVSVREMARRRGCTHGAVQKAISTGRIPASAVERDDRKRIKSLDFEAATEAWNANTDVDQAARTLGGAATVAGGSGTPTLPLGQGAGAPSAQAAGAQEMRVASTEAKRLQSQLLELELLRELGVLVSADDQRGVSQRRYRAMRDKFLAVADRLADECAAERDAARVHAAITREIERTLNELADDAAAEYSAVAEAVPAERVEA